MYWPITQVVTNDPASKTIMVRVVDWDYLLPKVLGIAIEICTVQGAVHPAQFRQTANVRVTWIDAWRLCEPIAAVLRLCPQQCYRYEHQEEHYKARGGRHRRHR